MRYVILSVCVLLGCQEAQAAKKVVAKKKAVQVVRVVQRPVFVNHGFNHNRNFNFGYGGFGGFNYGAAFAAPCQAPALAVPCASAGCFGGNVGLNYGAGGGGCFGGNVGYGAGFNSFGYGNGSFLLRDRFLNGRRFAFGFNPFFRFGGRHGGFAFGF